MPLLVKPLPATAVNQVFAESMDEKGGAPLRCCLRDSRKGEWISLASATPPGPVGPYLETGPVFIHPRGCSGPTSDGFPAAFASRRLILRVYGAEGTILGGEIVEPGTGEEVAERLLADPDAAFLHGHNIVHGCYLFRVDRALD